MKVKTLIAAAALLTGAGAVFAGDVDATFDHTHFVSTRTRAEVIAEMQHAAAKTSVAHNSEYVVNYNNVVSTRTRNEVHNEAIQAIRSGRANSDIGG